MFGVFCICMCVCEEGVARVATPSIGCYMIESATRVAYPLNMLYLC